MKTFFLLLIICLPFITNSQTTNLNTFDNKQIHEAEHVFEKFKTEFNLDAKILAPTPQNGYSTLDQKIFSNYIYNELFKLNPLIDVIEKKQTPEQLIDIYTNKLKVLFKNQNTYRDFNTYKTNYLNSYQTQVNSQNNAGRTAGQPCVNIDVEDGTFNGWDATFGRSCRTGNRCYNQTAIGTNANHTIMNGAGNDPDVPALNVQSPFGGNNTIRLGDLDDGNGAATVAHTFLVTANQPIFTYAFAVALEDNGHDIEEQPFFAIDFFDQNGAPINNCGTYYVAAGAGNPGFQNGPGIWEWKDWASIYLDMSAYIGTNVTILFTISDCDQGGHEGRAYIDAECLDPEITYAPNCNGRTLVAPPGLWQYQWKDANGNPVGNNQTLDINIAGRYSVDLISESGCVVTLDTLATILTPLSINHISQDISCNGLADGSITINANDGTPPYQYSIDNGVTFQNVNIFNGLADGNYQIVVMDAAGCTENGLETINEPTPIVINEIHTDASCNNICDGSITLNVAGGTVVGLYSYVWNGAAACPCAAQNNLCDGPYTIDVSDDNGCTSSITVNIDEPTPVILSSSNDTTICNGATVNRVANMIGGTAPYTYTWNNGALIFNGDNVTVTPNNNINFIITGTDANGCSESKTLDITVLPLLNVQAFANPLTICSGDQVNLSATGTGGLAPYTYTWDNGIGLGQNQVVSPLVTTTYTVTFDDACETPPLTAPITVTVNPLPTVMFDADRYEGCTPTTVNFTNTTDPLMVANCTWKYGNGTSSTNCTPASATYDNIGCFDVRLIVETPDGCIDSLTQYNFICNHPYPVADFEASPWITDVWSTEIEFTNTSTLNDYNFWTYDEIANSTRIDSTIVFPEDYGKIYDICLKVETVNGCADSICKPVEIEERSYFFVPNTFTPDGDGKNDYFAPVTVGIDDDGYNFSVFNRWGDLLFTTDRIGAQWDGMDRGKLGVQDTYIWKVQAILLETGKKIEQRGHVNLVR